jgi:hypothetical protein
MDNAPQIKMFIFEDGNKVIDKKLTKAELLEVIEFLSLELKTVKEVLSFKKQPQMKISVPQKNLWKYL